MNDLQVGVGKTRALRQYPPSFLFVFVSFNLAATIACPIPFGRYLGEIFRQVSKTF